MARRGTPAGILPSSRAVQIRTIEECALENVLELLRPGSFVRLRNHPDDLPPFQVLHCRGGRCWVRQQAWGELVQWEVAHRQLTAAA